MFQWFPTVFRIRQFFLKILNLFSTVDKELQRNEEVWGPHFFGTDYGACCYFNGDIGMDPLPQGVTYAHVSSGLLAKS